MDSTVCRFAHFDIAYRNVPVERSSEYSISVGNSDFSSSILAKLLEKAENCYVYCIYPSCPVCVQEFTFEELEKAEEHLLSLLKNEFSNPKCINPGVVFDWHLSSAEKMLHLLAIKNVKYDKFTNTLMPYQTKIGFVFDAPDSYLGNCQFCNQESCEHRSFAFDNELLERLLHEN
jgi:hypothetical protein